MFSLTKYIVFKKLFKYIKRNKFTYNKTLRYLVVLFYNIKQA